MIHIMKTDRLTLKEALKSGRLDEFIREQEAAGIGPASESEFLSAVETIGLRHQLANLLAHPPSGFVGNAEIAIQFLAAHAVTDDEFEELGFLHLTPTTES